MQAAIHSTPGCNWSFTLDNHFIKKKAVSNINLRWLFMQTYLTDPWLRSQIWDPTLKTKYIHKHGCL